MHLLYCCTNQWRRSVVKSEGVRVSQVKPSNYKPTEIHFRFRRWQWAIWSFSDFFRFQPKMNFNFRFIFRFRSKKSFALGRKYYVRNWSVTKFCDIGTDVFRFRFSAENGISFSSAFSFTNKNEKYIFGRPLHQTVSDYTLRKWFSNTQQSRFRTGCRCLEN